MARSNGCAQFLRDEGRRADDHKIVRDGMRSLLEQFIRLRASEFFRNPDAGLEKLFKRLKEVGIEPIGPATADETAATNRGEEIKKKVLKRAEQIRTRWQNIPEAPAPKPTVTEAPDETGQEEDEESREAA